jgi:hypothetical protein
MVVARLAAEPQGDAARVCVRLDEEIPVAGDDYGPRPDDPLDAFPSSSGDREIARPLS